MRKRRPGTATGECHANRPRQIRGGLNGFMTVEAVFLFPFLALLLVFLLTVCSYLYQNCFLKKTAYIAALRGSLTQEGSLRKSVAYHSLEQLVPEQVLSFGEEKRQVDANFLRVSVTLQRPTPLSGVLSAVTGRSDQGALLIQAKESSLCRDPVSFLRSLHLIRGLLDEE